MTQLKGSHALITGGGSGIGFAIAEAYTKAGATVTITGRGEERLHDALLKLPEGNLALQMDVTKDASIAAGVDSAIKQNGPITHLINNAGQALAAPFHKTDLRRWQHILDVNLTSVYRLISAVLPGMKEERYGRIINVASTAALKGYAYTSAYCASKHGVLGLTRALATELSKTDITVNAICPGFTETDIAMEAINNIVITTGRTPEEAEAELCKFNPQKRMIKPEEIADVALWLATANRSVTGQALPVAGGEI